MYYQIRRKSDGRFFGSPVVDPSFSKVSDEMLKAKEIKSVLGWIRKFHPRGIKVYGERRLIPLSDLEVVEVHMTFSNPRPIEEF